MKSLYAVLIVSMLIQGCATTTSFNFTPISGSIFENSDGIKEVEIGCSNTEIKDKLIKFLNDHSIVNSKDAKVKISLVPGSIIFGVDGNCDYSIQGGTRRMINLLNGSLMYCQYSGTVPRSDCEFFAEQNYKFTISKDNNTILYWTRGIVINSLSQMTSMPVNLNDDDLPEYLTAVAMFAFEDYDLLLSGTQWQQRLMLIFIAEYKKVNAISKIKELQSNTKDEDMKIRCQNTLDILDRKK